TVALDGKAAPCNVQSIKYLISKKFYDQTPCPRSVNSGIFVVQCGDPSGTTSGGPTYTTKDSNGALGKNYTVIGHVTAGLSILQKVATGGDDGSNQAGGGHPKIPLYFTKVTVK